jgi:hypothetical protein
VRAVAHQRAGVALRVVVLGLGKAVVDEERRTRAAALKQPGHGGDEGLGLRVDFGDVVVRAIDFNRRAQIRSAGLAQAKLLRFQ